LKLYTFCLKKCRVVIYKKFKKNSPRRKSTEEEKKQQPALGWQSLQKLPPPKSKIIKIKPKASSSWPKRDAERKLKEKIQIRDEVQKWVFQSWWGAEEEVTSSIQVMGVSDQSNKASGETSQNDGK
jgi:hypothetical protein